MNPNIVFLRLLKYSYFLFIHDFCQAINESLGTAKIVKVSKEEALIRKDLSQADYDMLTVNIRLEGSTVKDMGLEWKYEVKMDNNSLIN